MNSQVYACPHCGGYFHEITDKFSLKVPLRGDMFKKTHSFALLMWDTCFIEDESVNGDAVICPECEQTYGDTVTGLAIPSSLVQADDK